MRLIFKNRLLHAALILITVFSFNSCSKDNIAGSPGYATVSFLLTDAPCDYDHLYIDVQGIEIHSDSNGWESLTPFNAGVYDVLELSNGLDTLLCKVELPEGKISQIRLILGDNNSIVVDGNSQSLKVPSGSQSGLKLNLHQTLTANTSYSIWLDFDACKSVVEKGNGDYSLKPVIRAFADSANGKLTGYVLPDSANAVVYAIMNGDSISAAPEDNGYFMICGLDGTYDVYFESNNPNVGDSTISAVSVNYGEIVSVDTVNLQ